MVDNEAAGMKIAADINQKPLDHAVEINAIWKSVAAGTVAETPLERIKRLTAKPVAVEEVATA